MAVADLEGLSRSDGEPLQIRGSDALNVPLGLTPEEVLADLDVLEKLLKTDPLPSLKLLEQLAAVRNPETRKRLDELLSGALDGADGNLGLAWPHERVDENGTPDSWVPSRLWPGGRNGVRTGHPEWSEIRAALDEIPAGSRLARLDAEGREPISQAIPLRRWIAFEGELDGHTYALYDGSWYQIHHEYVGNINRMTEELFDRPVDDLAFPKWKALDNEEGYNMTLASALGGACLDRKVI